MRLKADLTLFAVAVIWGTGFISQGIAARYHVAYLFNGASFMLAGLLLIPFLPRKTKFSASQLVWMGIAGTVLFLGSAFQQVGILYTKVANAGFITSLYTVFTPFILWVLFREKPHWIDLVAVSIASLGAYLLSTSGRFQFQAGDGLELGRVVGRTVLGDPRPPDGETVKPQHVQDANLGHGRAKQIGALCQTGADQ